MGRSVSNSSSSVEEAVDLLSHRLAHYGLQLFRRCTAELLDAGEMLQQGQSFDPAHTRDLLNKSQNQGVQQPTRTSPEDVLPAIGLNLERAKRNIGSFSSSREQMKRAFKGLLELFKNCSV